jgi:polysaccharide biosynthesis/export protein ExoF
MATQVIEMNSNYQLTAMRWLVAALLMMGLALFQAPQSLAAQEEYRLDAGDILQFDFLNDEDLPVLLTVSSEGRVQVPLLGALDVAGLTIDEALAEMKKQLVEQSVLVDPRIAISVATWRSIFVLGDVKSPGNFPFQPKMTTEMAVGLAGGLPTAMNSAEDRVLSRARLAASILSNSIQISKEAVSAASNSAQLANRVKIIPEDIPGSVRSIVRMNSIDALKSGEEEVLVAEAKSVEAEQRLIEESVAEAQRQMAILDELADSQRQSIKFSEDGLKRGNDLMKKGLKTIGDIDDLRRQLVSDEGRLLSTLSSLSQAKRTISTLHRDKAQLENTRVKDASRARQDHLAMINQLVAERQGLEEQLLLVANVNVEDSADVKTIEIGYKIRRRGRDGSQDIAASASTALHPGDVLIISLNRAGSAAVPAGNGQADSQLGASQ